MPHILLLLFLLLLTACGPSDTAPIGPTDGPIPCAVDCDCPQGQLCNAGQCKQGAGPLYCCEKFGCPAGDRCVDSAGAVSTCGECVVSCDCPQGQICNEGACVLTDTPVFCCDTPGCPVNQGCVDTQEQVSSCPPECTNDCDCPQGQACSSSGLCLETSPPTFCCDKPGCPDGEICKSASGDRDVCGPKVTEPMCGNGAIESGETCDGNCPTTCNDNNACTTDTLLGQGTCTAECRNEVVTACQPGDGCCPQGCAFANDSDCPQPQLCGNGQLDQGETCDGDCPTACNDNDACTTDVLTGAPGACTAQCTNMTKTTCVGGDGCCPSGCSSAADSDCASVTQGHVGDACTRTDQCQGTQTLCRAQSDRPLYEGGYCTRYCQTSADCDANSHCAMRSGWCVRGCVTSGDCRAGYQCVDDDNDDVLECVPAGGNVGDACTRSQECRGPSAECLQASDGIYKDGYCTRSCFGGRGCDEGSTCTSERSCARNCASDQQCRGQGYACLNRSGVTACVATNNGSGEIGDPCEGVWSCGPDANVCAQRIDTLGSFPDGICTRTCGASGDPVCETGTACVGALGGFPFPIGGDSFCLEECMEDVDCRTGYTCESRTSPLNMTTVKVCLGPFGG